MAIGSTPEELAITKKMVSRKTAWWYLMKLPNDQWGALWYAGLDLHHGRGLSKGDYTGLAYMGTRKGTVNFIINDLKRMAVSEPDNCPFKEQYIKDLAWHRSYEKAEMASVNAKECEAAGLNPLDVKRIAQGLSRYAKEAKKLGIEVFGGSGTVSLRFDDGGNGNLILAEIQS